MSILLVLIVCDVIGQSIMLYGDADSDRFHGGSWMLLLYAGSGLQALVQICYMFWYFFLVWRTFLFRFGLLGKLLKHEFPVTLFLPLNFLLFLIERGIRVVTLLGINPDAKADISSIYDVWYYQIAFWLRNIALILFSAYSIKAAIQIGQPKYYKPQKWLVA